MQAKNAVAWLVALANLAAVAAVDAAPVTYDFTSGYVTLSADVGGVDYLPAGAEISFSGTQVTFDSASLTVPSFQFLESGSQTLTLTGPGALSGEKVTISGLDVNPAALYSSSAFLSGSGYGFTAGQIDASGMYSLAGSVTRASTAFSGVNNSLNGTISLGGTNMIQLTGVTLGTFSVAGQTVTLKGDIVFEGATPVPLPDAAWLLASGLAFLLGISLVRLRARSGTAIALSTLAVVLGLVLAPRPSLAVTVDVIGGPGLDQGALCLTGLLCPGTSPAFSLMGAGNPANGSFVYTPGTPGTGTVSFTLTLTSNVSFGSETLLAGSSFSAAGVPVSVTSLGKGAVELDQSGAASGLASVSFSPGLPAIQDAPAISGLTCSIGTGSDQCGVSMGSAGLEVGPAGAQDYNAFLTFNTNVAPVPLPAAAWLMLSGLGCFAALRRKRRP